MDSAQLLAKYQKYLLEKGLSSTSVERKLSSVRAYLGFLESKSPPSLPAAVSLPLNEEEIRLKLSALGIKVPEAKEPLLSRLLIIRLARGTWQTLKTIPSWRYTVPYALKYQRPQWFIRYQKKSYSRYLNLGLLLVICATLAIGGYEQYKKIATPKGKVLGTVPIDMPQYLSFQGRLVDSYDTPITVDTHFRFSIYNSPTASGAAQLYEEAKWLDPDEDGIFNTLIGDTTALPASLFKDNAALWLGITVSENAEMTDRQQVATVAYAFNSQYLRGYGVGATNIGADVNEIPVVDGNGNIIIAAAGPSLKTTSGTFKIESPTLALMTAGTSGNVGIGTSTAGSKLVVSGGVGIGSASGTSPYLSTSAPDGGLIIEGNVGIGTTSPTENLHIAGDIRVTGAYKDSGNFAGMAGFVLTSTGVGTSWAPVGSLAVGNADTVDSMHANQFLRADANSSLSSGNTLTIDSGATLDINGDLAVADTNIALDGASTNFTTTGNFSLNDSQFLVNKASGNVGIGTTGNKNKLDVYGTMAFGAYAGAYSAPAYSMIISGNIGLGFTSPDVKLHIRSAASANDIYMEKIENTNRDVGLEIGTQGNVSVIQGYSISSGGMAASKLSLLPSGGNVGIGTTSPKNKLDVSGALAVGSYAGVYTAPSNSLIVSGNVGIGVTTPLSALHVAGNALINNTSAQALLEIRGATNAQDANLFLAEDGSAGGGLVYSANTNRLYLYTTVSGAAAGSYLERIAIDRATGNVGIGTTNPTQKLDVVGNLNVSGTGIFSNTKVGGLQDEGNSLGDSGQVLTSTGTGVSWGTLTSLIGGTYESPLTFTSGLTRDGDTIELGGTTALSKTTAINQAGFDFGFQGGNVGVGTTAPTSGYILDVNGNMRVGSSAYINSTAYFNANVGIGTTRPEAKLHVAGGNILLGNNQYYQGERADGVNLNILGVDGSNNIQFGSGSAQDIYFDTYNFDNAMVIKGTSGNVGIGTTNPGAKLQVYNSSTSYTNLQGGSLSVVSPNGSTTVLSITGLSTADLINVFDGSTEIFTILDGGNVGIGTTNPGSLLEISGTGNVTSTIASSNQQTPSLVLQRGTGTDAYIDWRISNNKDTGNLNFGNKSTGAESLKISFDINGNVGIGTTNPTQKLDVVGNLNVSGTGIFTNTKVGGLQDAGNSLGDNGQVLTSTGTGVSWGTLSALLSGAYESPLTFINGLTRVGDTIELGGATALSKTTAINQAGYNFGFQGGNVGIGTTSPTSGYLLDVNGNIKVGGTGYFASYVGIGTTSPSAKLVVTGEGTGEIKFGSTGIGGNYVGMSLNGTLSSTSYNLLSSTNNTNLFINRPTGGDIYFRENNVDSITFKNGGNVGIGTTGNKNKLDINGSLAVGSYAGVYSAPANGAIISGNVGIGTTSPAAKVDVLQSGDTFTDGLAITRAGANRIVLFLNSNNDTFNIYKGGSERFTIKNDGNVGVGTTNPTQKLDVVGNINASGTGIFGNTKVGGLQDEGNSLGTLNQVLTSTGTGVSWGTLSALLSGAYESPLTFINGLTRDGDTIELGGTTALSKVTAINQAGFNFGFQGGNVGVGTTAPTSGYVLDVNGNMRVGGTGYFASRVGIGIASPDTNLHVYSGSAGTVAATVNSLLTLESGGVGWMQFLSPNTAQSGILFGDPESTTVGRIRYDHSLNMMDFFTNDGIRMAITSTGNVGIGTTGNKNALDLNGSLAVGSYAGVYSAPSNGAIISGNVGIGTTAPASKLNVVGGDISLSTKKVIGSGKDYGESSRAASGYLKLYDTNDGSTALINTGSYDMYFGVNDSYDLTIINGGNIGIGTTNPSQRLDVAENLNVSGTGILQDFELQGKLLDAGNAVGSLNQVLTSTGTGVSWGTLSALLSGAYESPLTFINGLTRDGNTIELGGATPLSKVTAINQAGFDFGFQGGNVGIGTTSPVSGYVLDVNGNIKVGGTTYFADRVGIGTTNPTSKLTVVRTGTTQDTPIISSDLMVYGDGSAYVGARDVTNDIEYAIGTSNIGGVFVGSMTNHNLWLRTNNTTRVTINTSGNVGIGTTGPEAKLHVAGGNILLGNNQYYQGERADGVNLNILGVDGSNNIQFGSGSAQDIYFDTYNFDNAMVIKGTSGNVGIGTTSPSSPLEISRDSGASQRTTLMISNPNATYKSASILFKNGANNRWDLGTDLNIDGTNNFFIRERIGGNTRLLIDTNGNVGIGTTSPSNPLHIVSSVEIPLYISTSHVTDARITLENTATGGKKWSIISGADGVYGPVGGFALRQTTDGYSVFKINSTGDTVGLGGNISNSSFSGASLVINNGNVGIGTTNPTQKLDVVGNLNVSGTGIFTNTKVGGLQDAGNSLGTLNQVLTSTGTGVSWGTLSALLSGAYESPLTFINGLTRDGNTIELGGATPLSKVTAINQAGYNFGFQGGNVGVGTTAPTSGYILDVNGNMRVGSSAYIASNVYVGSRLGIGIQNPDTLNSGANNLVIGGGSNTAGMTIFSGNANQGNIYFADGTGTPAQGVIRYEHPTDRLEFWTNNTRQFVLDSSGNVGIGTTGPSAYVHISSTQSRDMFRVDDNGVEDTSPFVIDQNGNVGIGTTGPSQKLDVVGNLNVSGTGIFGSAKISGALFDNGSYIGASNMVLTSTGTGVSWATLSVLPVGNAETVDSFHVSGLTNYVPRFSSSTQISTGSIMDDGTNVGIGTSFTGTAKFSVMGGNVGIGTTSPSQTLDVNGNINVSGTGIFQDIDINGKLLAAGNLPGTDGMLLTSTGTGVSWTSVTALGFEAPLSFSSGLTRTDNDIHLGGASALQEVTAINQAGFNFGFQGGNVGVGTTSPTSGYILDVNGNFRVGGTAYFNSYVGIGTTSPATKLEIYQNANTGTQALIWNDNTGTGANAAIAAGQSQALGDWINFGVTGTNYTTAGGFVQDSGFISAESNLTGGMSLITRNASAPIRFYTASHTNERMRITETGNVGIGTTGNKNKLDINGSLAVGSYAGVYSAPSNGAIISGNVGIGTSSPGTNLAIYNGNESTTLSNFTGSLTNAGINIVTDYTTNAFTPGIFWSAQDNQPTKPKAGIWMFEDASGSHLLLGTSDAYSTGITNTLVMNEGGNIGIGTTNPSNKFQLNQSADINTGGFTLLNSGATSSLRLWLDSSDRSRFDTGASATGIILLNGSGTGNVGIGSTANPTQKLDVSGNINVSNTGIFQDVDVNGKLLAAGNLPGTDGMLLTSTGTGVSWTSVAALGFEAPLTFSNGLTRTDNDIHLGGQLSELTKIDMNSNNIGFWNTGNVGVGTTSPVAKFNISSTEAIDLFRVDDNGPGDTTPFMIDQNGNVGIGTTNFPQKLNVAGTIAHLTGGIQDASLYSDSNGGIISSTDEGGVVGFKSYYTAGAELKVGNARNTKLYLIQNDTERLTIDTGGNVGIGTTNPGYLLDVNGGLRVGNTALFSGNITVGATSFLTSTKVGLLLDTVSSPGTNGMLLTSTGTGVSWTTVAALGFEAPLTFTSGLTRTDNDIHLGGATALAEVTAINQAGNNFGFQGGNVGIGTTAPTSGYILDVNGNMRVGSSAYINSTAYFNGNVGIGTTNPGARLEVYNGSIELDTNNGTNMDLAINEGGNYRARLGFANALGGFLSMFEDGGSRSVLIRAYGSDSYFNAGNVGIGTTSPTASFQVGNVGTGQTGNFVQINSSGNMGIGATAGTYKLYVNGDLYVNGNSTIVNNLQLKGNQILNADGTATIVLSSTPSVNWSTLDAGAWQVYNTANVGKAALAVDQLMGGDIFTASASGAPKFVINNSGNVGIGTTNPGQKLDIAGITRTWDLISSNLVLPGSNYSTLTAFAGFNGYVNLSGGLGTGGISRIDSLGNLNNIGSIKAGETLLSYGGTFAAAVPYSISAFSYAVAIGDFNGDGKADIATANYNGDNVSVLPNNGDGTFDSRTDYAVGTNPYSVAVGDLNGDGKADIATANYGTDNVSVLLNDGDGTFAAKADYAIGGTSPESVAIGDFNGDGKADIATANTGSSNVSAFLNDGDGTFASAANYVTGTNPRGVAVGDLNGDGKADIATANYGTDNVSVLLNDGDGTFAAKADYAIGGTNPYSVAVGDLNGDGKADIATANYSTNNVSVLLNDGDGTFGSSANYTVGQYPETVAVGDLNGDGKADIATANSGTDNVSVLLNDGDGTFAAKVDYDTGAYPYGIAIGELNGDGKADITTASGGGASLSVLLNVARPIFFASASSGNVGIGTTSPTAKLDIAGSTSTISNSSGDITINAASNNISFAGDSLININNIYAAGNVGIGTSSPNYNLQVGEGGALTSGIPGGEPDTRLHVSSDTVGGAAAISVGVNDGTNKHRATFFQRDNNSGGDWGLWNTYTAGSNRDFVIGIGSSEKMRIKTDGNVGIGTTNPQNLLHVAGIAQFVPGTYGKVQITTPTGTNGLILTTNDTNQYRADIRRAAYGLQFASGASTGIPVATLTINDSGNVGIGSGSTSPAYALDVGFGASGVNMRAYDVYTHDGSATSFSDQRLKDIQGSFSYGLNEVLGLNPIFYKYKEGNELNLSSDFASAGLIAQEVQGLIPEAVEEGEKGYLTLNSTPIVYALINAVKELNSKVDGLASTLAKATDFIADNIIVNQRLTSPVIDTGELTADGAKLTRVNSDYISPLSGNDLVIDLTSPSDFGTLLVKGNAEFTGNVGIGQTLETKDASVSGELYAESARIKKLRAESIEGLEALFATFSAQYINNTSNMFNTNGSVSGLEENIASDSSSLSNLSDLSYLGEGATGADLLSDAANWPIIDPGNDVKITANVKIYGTTTLAQTLVTGPLTQDGTLLLDSGNSINVIGGTLYLQNQGMGGIDLLAGKVTIDMDGNAVFEGDLTVKGTLFAGLIKPVGDQIVFDLSNLGTGETGDSGTTSGFGKILARGQDGETVYSLDASGSAEFRGEVAASSFKIARDAVAAEPDIYGTIEATASAGLAKIPAGHREVTIESPFVKEKSLVYLTPIGSTANQVIYLARTSPDYQTFTAAIDRILTKDILFSWWIVN